jgi:hypothetical protein
MHEFCGNIQTPTHDHSQRITHYCRRLSVVSREMQPSIASVNIANMGTKKERRLLSEAIRLVVLVGEDLLTTLAAGHAVLLLLAW